MMWQHVTDKTWRLSVPGGWLYRHDDGPLCFVAGVEVTAVYQTDGVRV